MRLFLTGLALLLTMLATAGSEAGQSDAGVRGTLVHKDSGQPVIGAPIQLDGDRFAVSDEQGLFVFREVSPGTHSLSIEDPECAPFSTSFEKKAGSPTVLNFALDARGEQDTEEVIIRSQRLEQEVSDTVLELDEVKKIPGTQGDVLKIVQSLPGVARSTPFGGAAAGIVVRGAAPEDSKVLIDDHTVPLLYHFGALKSVLNSDMLKRIDFLPGGFGAEFGSAIGGIVDVQTLPCNHERYDGYIELSAIDAGFFVKGPIGEDAGFFAAARRSTIDFWLPHVLENMAGFEMTVAPVYYDYQFKLDWSVTPDDHLSLLSFGSSDELKLIMEKPPTGDAEFRGAFGMKIQFHHLYLRWVHAPQSADWQTSVSLVGGWDTADVDAGPFFIHSKVPNLRLRADVEWQITPRWKWRSGFLAALTSFDLTHQMIRPPKEGNVSSEMHTMEVISGKESWLVPSGGVYTSLALEPWDGTMITGGLRLDGYAFGPHGDWSLSPRLAFKHVLRKGTVFKAGVGLYYQAAPADELSEDFGNPKLEMERAIHYTVGLEQELPLDTHFDFTFFYKSMDKLVVPHAENVYANRGIGKVSGLEVLLRRGLSDGLFGWLAYTLMRSQRQDGSGEPWRLFDYDQTHILTLVAGYRLPTSEKQPNHGLQSGWEFGLRFQLVTGNPNTPILGGIFDSDYDTYLPIAGEVNSERLPMYHRLDLRVDYTWAFVNWALSIFLDVQNVYNYRSIEGIEYNYDYTDRTYFKGLPVLPALGLRGSF